MKRILVVDDEEQYRRTVSTTLRQSGFFVFEARDGQEGSEIAQHHIPDLIISDVMMEKLDGFALLDKLRMDPATSTIPFIFMTGLSDKDSMRKGMTSGADDFLVKPFTGSDLLAAVESRLVRQKEMAEEAERKLKQLRSSISLSLPHEIRTPLSGILGFAEVLGDESSGLSSTEIAQCGKLIHKAARRMQRLLENFMIYAQIEMVASDQKRMLDLRGASTMTGIDLLELVSRKKAEQYDRMEDLTFGLSENQVAISESYLKKICEELLDNAFKFSEAGKKIAVRSSREDDQFVLSISDSGRGMTGEQIANLGAYMQFERRYHEQQGAGLGLIIAKRLIELHGGHLEFRTTEGGGLTVILRLPVTERV